MIALSFTCLMKYIPGALVKSQWVQTNGAWYYCGADGAMLTSQMIGGQYYVDKNGVWVQ